VANSPTSRSLEMLRNDGYVADVIERWIPRAMIRKDWCGFGDILACGDENIALIQTTTASNLMARWHKVVANPAAEKWLNAGGEIFVHGWAKRGGRGERKLWQCDVRKIRLEDISSASA